MSEVFAAPSFGSLGVTAEIERKLVSRGFVEPFYIQSLVLPEAIRGRDILAKSPTGSGKTLAFGVPIVERLSEEGNRPEALVLVQTRELALQVAEEIGSFSSGKNLKVALAYGGTPVHAQAKRLKGAHIVVATPGRLQDLLERKMVSLDGIRVLVLDEADRMLDMGFQPQVDRILRSVPRNRQTMLFSATLDGAVATIADRYTDNPSRFRAELPAERRSAEAEHAFVSATRDGKIVTRGGNSDTLVEQRAVERGLALVFVRTKHGADKLANNLARHDIAAAAMHG